MSGMFAYVGSRTTRERHARGDGITVFALDAQGALERVQVVSELVNPSFLALNRAGTRLYTVHGDQQEVSAFAVGDDDGKLTFINRISCEGRNPVHLALDASERFMVVSNHLTGAMAVLRLREDGALDALVQLEKLPGEPGPHRKEQPFSKPHFNPFDPARRFVVVPDKGLDRIFVFRFEGGRLVPAAQPWVDTRENAGPRHVAFHPRLGMLYSVNELDSTVTSYSFDAATGALQPLQVLSALPETFTGNSRAAEIEVSADGRFVYSSNRGYDSIAVFAVDPQSGLLRFIAAEPTGGRTPRFFALSPNGTQLYALNEDSDTIVRFAVNRETGRLTREGDAVSCGSPVCMVFGVR